MVIIKAMAKVEITIEKGSLILSLKKNKTNNVSPGIIVITKAPK